MLVTGLGVCFFAFLTSFLAGRRGLAWGLAVTLFWGYVFGILRANILNAVSHFIFDASLAGCYLSLLNQKVDLRLKRRMGALNDWVSVLSGWTILIALLPFQTPLVTLVGIRGNLFFIPVLLLSARLSEGELRKLVVCLAGLNLFACGFGIAEYFQGIERFYPISPVTSIIYRSHDVAGGFYRIPAVFSNAHSYAGTMVATLPVLLGFLAVTNTAVWQRIVVIAGIVAACFGVLFANTRTNFVATALLIIGFLLLGKMRPSFKILLCVVIAAIGVVALSNERFQRFRSLEDSSAITGRLAGSVNRTFLEVLVDYPLGNGLGGGGTSIPHFLENQVRRAVAVENEYARIALELGFPGFLLWAAFLIWILLRGFSIVKQDPWLTARRLGILYLCTNFGLSLLGTGLLTAIPGTMLTFILAGWLVTRPDPSLLPGSGKALVPPPVPAARPTMVRAGKKLSPHSGV